MDDLRFNKLLLAVNSTLPLGWLAYDWYNGGLGANPIEYFLRATGVLTLLFLLVSLTVTPLRKIFGWNSLIKYRRVLGLYAFFYGVVHLTTYIIFDKGGDVALIASDVVQRPFIAIGMLAFTMLVPLAVTSTNGWVKRLGGKRWARLHTLVYPIAVLGVVHFWMIVKSDIFWPAMFAGALALLFAVRFFTRSKQKQRASSYGLRAE